MSTVAPEHVSSDPPAEVEPVTNEELALISLPEGDTPAESGEETAGVTPSGSSAATKKLPPKPPKMNILFLCTHETIPFDFKGLVPVGSCFDHVQDFKSNLYKSSDDSRQPLSCPPVT